MKSFALLLAAALCATGAPEVRLVRVPGGGAVPDAEVDAQGGIHLAFVTGENLFHTRSTDGGKTFAPPRRVNATPDRVHPAGLFRGPDVALGKAGRPLIIWYPNAYQRKAPKTEWGVQFARLKDGGGDFETSRNLNARPSDNFSIAADGNGRVTVFWMAAGLFMQESTDDGATFGEPHRIALADTCECCASRARFLPDGTLACAYRDKKDNERDMFVLVQPRDARLWSRAKLSGARWNVNACPMTGTFLDAAPGGLLAAWETKTQVYFARCDANGVMRSTSEITAGQRGGRWPVALSGPGGVTLVTWKRGNAVEWQLFDADDKPQGEVKSSPGTNPHRHAAALAKDGAFVIVH
jgi:hypothetical protein